MLNSMKSSATEKDRNAATNARDVMGRVVQPHDQAWARSEQTTKAGMASCIGSDMSIVGNREQRWRNGEAERLRSLEIDDQFELCRLLDRKVAWFLTIEDSRHVNAC